uniref:Uncharacterized protein n=1 Tax=Chlamydomonas leiostraca TaxID=1034604 RepID=A0A7S0RFV9_9CHLO|mmetsp:Transcript_21920/g.55791  ORF Transcript_21920/g.55791 Transcript_21920/m.55791 type:complete len:110 (+) Transcript_21920:108-437(+)
MAEQGVITFVFDEGKHWEVTVFVVRQFTGQPSESDEMAPEWYAYDSIPFDNMWADDVHWYPLLLVGKSFRGLFAFQDTTKLVWHTLSESEPHPLTTDQWLKALAALGSS